MIVAATVADVRRFALGAWGTGVDELLPESKLAGVSRVTPTFATDLP